MRLFAIVLSVLRSWVRTRTALAVENLALRQQLAVLSILFFLAVDLIGIGPNLGLPFSYYGRFNRIFARIEANPELEVSRVDLHRDTTLEDFYITVRTPTDGDVRLVFEGASDRPFSELLQELKKVGM